MEWLMSKGYVPDSDNANVMKPNPFDKRYKEPRHRYLPPLATTPIEYIYAPKPKRSTDPFAGIADPIEKSFSPLPDIGIDDAVEAPKNQVGPLLNPDLPDLKNSPLLNLSNFLLQRIQKSIRSKMKQNQNFPRMIHLRMKF